MTKTRAIESRNRKKGEMIHRVKEMILKSYHHFPSVLVRRLKESIMLLGLEERTFIEKDQPDVEVSNLVSR